jgi:hypothetical protein
VEKIYVCVLTGQVARKAWSLSSSSLAGPRVRCPMIPEIISSSESLSKLPDAGTAGEVCWDLGCTGQTAVRWFFI